MVHQISMYFAKQLSLGQNKKNIPIEVYCYGIELLSINIFTIITMLFVSYMMNMLLYGIIFIATFIPLKMSSGGYHALTFFKCFIVSNLFGLMGMLGTVFFGKCINDIKIIWLVMIISASYIVTNDPVKNSRHPVGNKT